MVLAHAYGDMQIKLDRRADQVRKDYVLGKQLGTPAGLHDDKAAGCIGGLHERRLPFYIAAVERRQPKSISAAWSRRWRNVTNAMLGNLYLP